MKWVLLLISILLFSCSADKTEKRPVAKANKGNTSNFSQDNSERANNRQMVPKTSTSQENMENPPSFANHKNEELISISPVNKPFSEIIDGIRERFGVNIVYDPEISEISVNIKLVQVPWRKTLEVIAKKHNCLIEDLDGVIKISIQKYPK